MPMVVEDVYEMIPRALHVIGAHHPDSERPVIIRMEAVGRACYFAFTTFERAEFCASLMKASIGLDFVSVRMEPHDFAKLHRFRSSAKLVAINPRLRDCHRCADMIDVAELAALAD